MGLLFMPLMYGGGNGFFLMILIIGASAIVGQILRSKFKKYSKTPLPSGLSGREVAEKMLRESMIFDVKVLSVPGQLSDHYDPINKTVNLSPEVYEGHHVAAAAVAAHECGHAIQHATAYSFLELRSKLVPVVSFSSNIVQWVLLGGVLMINAFPALLLIGIVLFALTTLFSLVTLPVEYDASKRALAWLESSTTTLGMEHEQAKSALNWAARTYLVAAIGSVATLLYYVSIFMGGGSDRD